MSRLHVLTDSGEVCRVECDCLGVLADDGQPCPLEICDGTGLVRPVGCHCNECEAEKTREGCEVRP